MIRMAIASMPTSNEQTTNFLLILWFWNENIKRIDVDHRQKISTYKSEWTSTCLELLPRGLPLQCSWCFFCLKMISKEFNGLRKTFGIRIMIFPRILPLELFIGRFCMFLKLWCVQKARGFKLRMTYANFTFIFTDQQQSKFSISYLAKDSTVRDFLCASFIQR